MDNLNCLKSQTNGAPRAVVFMNDESAVSQAFIAADKKFTIEVENPSPQRVLLGLVSVYYAWHQSFPSAYKQALQFFAHKIFKTNINNNSAVGKFLKKLENSKNIRKSDEDDHNEPEKNGEEEQFKAQEREEEEN